MQVGTPGVEVAAQYVMAEAQAIADAAARHPTLTAQVDREQASGGINADFAGIKVASAYHNLTNVILYIAPSGGAASSRGGPDAMPPAVLLNAHFDSIFGTQGGLYFRATCRPASTDIPVKKQGKQPFEEGRSPPARIPSH